jgi:hypothetical protein
MVRPAAFLSPANVERPRLELNGPKLKQALETLISGTEEHGGIEQYVAALRLKSEVFQRALGTGKARDLELAAFKALCALIAPVRRRASAYLVSPSFEPVRSRIVCLLDGVADTTTTDRRLAEFCAGFPEDGQHRWVRDLAAEILHNVDPERYPLMCRWVWDARANTGVIREMWHAEDVDHTLIDVPDRYGTFVVLREELAQFLAANGVFRDEIYYVDLLTAQIYADYVSERGGNYLRTDFSGPADPMEHTRRLLGLDGVHAKGRTRLKSVDGEAFVVDDVKLLG